MTQSLNDPILFPWLLAQGKVLVASKKSEANRFSLARYRSDNRFLFKGGSNDHFRPVFFIDRKGRYRQIDVLGIHRKWARSFSSVWDFAQYECEIKAGEVLNCGELIQKLTTVKWDNHFSAAANLRRFLKKQPEDSVFGEAEFRAYWGQFCPSISASEWSKQFPD
jgi:hypothetical protein